MSENLTNLIESLCDDVCTALNPCTEPIILAIQAASTLGKAGMLLPLITTMTAVIAKRLAQIAQIALQPGSLAIIKAFLMISPA